MECLAAKRRLRLGAIDRDAGVTEWPKVERFVGGHMSAPFHLPLSTTVARRLLPERAEQAGPLNRNPADILKRVFARPHPWPVEQPLLAGLAGVGEQLQQVLAIARLDLVAHVEQQLGGIPEPAV